VNDSQTFLFADLAGFTALTEAHGDVEALEIACDFADRVRAMLAEHRAEEIKTIGDEVMLRVPDASDAVRLGLRITKELAAHGQPPVRVGMHSGPGVRRDGDWYGGTVNLASRVAQAAHPGEVMLTEATRREVGEPDDFEVVERGSRYFKNIPEPVPVHRAVPAGEAPLELEIDPVCKMAVDPKCAAAIRHRVGLTYWFCSQECAATFSNNPRSFIATSAAARAARKGFLINLSAFVVVLAVHLVAWVAGRGASPAMALVFIAWAVLLAIHFRAVRRVL
jgi:class 3 adenylate cyclase